ncbi:MAG: sortase [Acidimicrobiales bacterium]
MTATETAYDRELLLVPVPDGTVIEDWRAPDTVPPEVEEAPPEPPGGDQLPPTGGHEDGEGRPPIHVLAPLPTDSTAYLVRSALIVLALLAFGLILQLTWISGLEHRSAQVSLFNRFRTELALGTAPTGPKVGRDSALALGSPMAVLSIPSIGVKQVVTEGTTSSVLADGPGHLRDTVFPGGAGTSVILGRAAAYGGPFGQISDLAKGARITVTTGVGTSVFRVVDVRTAGAVDHPVAAGKARLTLGTAGGAPFVPSGVVWVDADKVGTPLAADYPLVSTVPPSEQPLGTDTSTLWALFFWLEILGVLVAGAVWISRRRGHAQAWIVFTAPLLLTWIFTANQIARLLPNLL